jgi:hypothetical protein
MTRGADNWRAVIAADPNGTETRRKNANPLMFNELAFLYTALFSVGATGFEPATSCSRSRRSTGLSYAPCGILVHLLPNTCAWKDSNLQPSDP